MLEKIILLSKKFISIKSISENPKSLEEILELALSNLKEFTIERFEKNGVKSVLVYKERCHLNILQVYCFDQHRF